MTNTNSEVTTALEAIKELETHGDTFTCPKTVLPEVFSIMDRDYTEGDFKYVFFGQMAYCKRTKKLIKRIKMNNDPVNHPSHYTDGKIEVIDFIEDKNLGYHLGNAVKYIARAGKKDPEKTVQDLEKAKWYLERKIKELKKGVHVS